MAPAGSFDRASFDAGLALLASRYRVRYEATIFERHRYLAGKDAVRLAQLTDALQSPEIRAVFCARGGYGAMRLLPGLTLPDDGRLLIGFSDITALHLWYQSQGRVSIHAPVLTQLGRLGDAAAQRLFTLLESPHPAPALHATLTFVPGAAEGPLVGGNMSVLTRLLGTPYMPSLAGAILLLEDVGERPYRLDRMWMHLQLAGVFRQIAGIALGTFTECGEREADYSSEQVLQELAIATGLPCAGGFPVGHGERNEALALGSRVRLDADARTLTPLEGAVQGD
ncbi:MAG: LD-carboxypeptidase [Sinobacteraceae bacterium]|nr:LD-carboxypeptidase [Nevskiaceae bacterium]